jgi:DNA-binding PadR family transcriptional regulator
MHPYEVAQTLRSRAKHESIRLNYGSLYGVVEGLERRKLVRARETVREGKRPERTIYEITETGKRELQDWLSELVSTPVKEYLQFEAALSLLPVLPPDLAIEVLRHRAAALEIRIAQSKAVLATATGAGLPRLFELEGEYTQALAETELEFVQRLVKEIESGELEGIDMWRSWFAEGAEMAWHPPDSADDA